MATITIRDFDDQLKTALRLRAARHGCSMQEEARDILRAALIPDVEQGEQDDSGRLLFAAIRARMEPLGGVDLELPPRQSMRPPPDFGE